MFVDVGEAVGAPAVANLSASAIAVCSVNQRPYSAVRLAGGINSTGSVAQGGTATCPTSDVVGVFVGEGPSVGSAVAVSVGSAVGVAVDSAVAVGSDVAVAVGVCVWRIRASVVAVRLSAVGMIATAVAVRLSALSRMAGSLVKYHASE